MTVAELIDKLQALPQDYRVITNDDGWPYEVDTVRVDTDPVVGNGKVEFVYVG